MTITMTYPRTITPEVHLLKEHYKRLERLVLIAIPTLFLVNEFVFRTNLAPYRSTLDSRISLFILILNGEIPYPEALSVQILLMGMSIVYTCIACFLPKWTLGSRGRLLRSTPPFDLGEMALAHFHVKHRTQHAVFWVWHHVLMWPCVTIATIFFCSLLNLARS